MGNFKMWMERSDVFGFEEIEAKKEKEDREEDDDLPIKPFGVQWFMDSLSRKRIGDKIKSSHAFLNEVIWGEKKVGAVRVRLQPNLVIYVERYIKDLEGEPTWVCKRVFKPDVKEYTGHEDIVAEEVFEEVQKLWAEKLDTAAENYDNLLNLTKRMSTRMQSQVPEMYIFQDVKEVNKHYYVIYFSLRGAGVGKLAGITRRGTRTPEATIDLNYNKERGLIQVILTTVTVGGEGEDWQLDIPYLNAFYTPSQSKDEIIDTVIAAFKYF